MLTLIKADFEERKSRIYLGNFTVRGGLVNYLVAMLVSVLILLDTSKMAAV